MNTSDYIISCPIYLQKTLSGRFTKIIILIKVYLNVIERSVGPFPFVDNSPSAGMLVKVNNKKN